MKFPIRLISNELKIDFLGKRWIAFALSIFLTLATIGSLATRGLNLGIDFTGGILIDAKFQENPELVKMRTLLKEANVGDVALQTIGKENNVLIRIGQTSDDEKARTKVINDIKTLLEQNFGSVEYRKVDYVGPKVGEELIKAGALALILTLAAIMVYIWFRFEWQYGLGGIIALIHDAILTVGFLSITQLQFDLSSIAAILTVVGYSINDSVVIFDRIRENMRKFKKMDFSALLNLSVNETLSRTIMTASTTIVSIIALVMVGGEVVRSFSLTVLFGIVIGTYSSIYIGSPILIYMRLRHEGEKESRG
ncbi:MAG: secF [Rickettsiaceae bacterium]|jgi:preprotein translocase SecF subunit|nr:secF [Rickettsiaceae bacterium]